MGRVDSLHARALGGGGVKNWDVFKICARIGVVRATGCPDPALAGQEATRDAKPSLPVAPLRYATRATSSPGHEWVKQ